MNCWLLAAGAIAGFTTLIHVFAGQIDPVRPFLKSDLAAIPKATLLVCWHMVSVMLLLSSAALLYAGINNTAAWQLPSQGIAIVWAAFVGVFVVVGGYFFGIRTLIKLPQWTLLLPVAILAWLGAR